MGNGALAVPVRSHLGHTEVVPSCEWRRSNNPASARPSCRNACVNAECGQRVVEKRACSIPATVVQKSLCTHTHKARAHILCDAGDHIERTFDFMVRSQKPWFLLVPQYVAHKV
eukprot:365887-Chlamydomonas_euryale.AAC.3